jgi:hypothetical protein
VETATFTGIPIQCCRRPACIWALIHSPRAMICCGSSLRSQFKGGVEKVINSVRVYLHSLQTLYFSCNALYGFVIVAVLALLDFLAFPPAGCYEFDPNRSKTRMVGFSTRRHDRYKGACRPGRIFFCEARLYEFFGPVPYPFGSWIARKAPST